MAESANLEYMLKELERVWRLNSKNEFDSYSLEKLMQDLLFSEKQWVDCLKKQIITREEINLGVLQYLYTWFARKLNVKESEVKGLNIELVDRCLSKLLVD